MQDEAPRLFVSQRAASLLIFDGVPVLAPVAGTSLSYAVNTNWSVFFDGDSGGWLRAYDANGPWAPAGTLPAPSQHFRTT
ncbi:hypothetical protein [Accumulibacter sp.]|uniref:hypothetical protein n=1 Tax=Accumulibacter sp. TaxID=2053492 RepID=UPI00263892A7|nr:hypothetical protein [Accumulibacter sp.]